MNAELLGYAPFHSIPFGSARLDSIPFHSIPFHSIPFHSIPFGSARLRSISLQYYNCYETTIYYLSNGSRILAKRRLSGHTASAFLLLKQ